MPYKVSIELQFDAAHRLFKYEGKCHNLHGHTYFAIVEATCDVLIPPGFVTDFGELKRAVKDWIDENWDHATILWANDPLVPILKDQDLRVYSMTHEPTAEYMASLLFIVVEGLLKTSLFPSTVTLTQVSIKETPTSTAKYYVNTATAE